MKLQEADEQLQKVKARVAELNQQVAELEEQFNIAINDKESAIQESERCQVKLDLANRLINALASEGKPLAVCKMFEMTL